MGKVSTNSKGKEPEVIPAERKENGTQFLEFASSHQSERKMRKAAKASRETATVLKGSAKAPQASEKVIKPSAESNDTSARVADASRTVATVSTVGATGLTISAKILTIAEKISADVLIRVIGFLVIELALLVPEIKAKEEGKTDTLPRRLLALLIVYMFYESIQKVRGRDSLPVKNTPAPDQPDLEEITIPPTAIDRSRVHSDEFISAEEILFHSQIVSVYELAQFCQQAYAKVPQATIGCWQFFSQSSPSSQGYYGVAYFNPEKKCVVIAHRGTDPTLLSNLLSDASLSFSKLPTAQKDAENFSKEVRFSLLSVEPDCLVIETGHSLGGFHAEMNIVLLASGYAMSFESPGIEEMCKTLQLHPEPDHFVSFFSVPNVVNTAKSHLGDLYHIFPHGIDKNEVLQLTDAKYLRSLAEAVIKSTTLADSAVNVGLSVLRMRVEKVIGNQVFDHSLDELIRAIHPGLGYPWLMRKVQQWPSSSEFLKTQAVSGSVVTMSSFSYSEHKDVTEDFPGYIAGDFVPPLLEGAEPARAKAYRIGALKRFDTFYKKPELRQAFIASMDLSEEEVAEVPLPSSSSISSSPSSFLPSSSSTQTTKEKALPAAKKAQPIEPSLPFCSSQRREKVILANSLVSDGFSLSEQTWVISLVKSPGEQEHAFLLLEGIKEGEPVHLRTDFFLNLDAREEITTKLKEVTTKLPTFMGTTMDILWSVSGSLVGKGFVRTKELSLHEYKELLAECRRQSWDITPKQAEEFLARIKKEVEKPHVYFRGGNHPVSSVSDSSGAEPHNCVTWCQNILYEEFNFKKTDEWLPVKWPSRIVLKVMEENAEPEPRQPLPSGSSFSFLPNPSSASRESESENTSASSAAAFFAKKGF